MSIQFINVGMAARQVAKKALQRKRAGKTSGKSHWSIKNIILEATRDPVACKHVENPLPPRLVFGITPPAIGQLCNQKANQAVNTLGHPIRKDTPVLLTIVASYPRERFESDPAGYQKWCASNLDFLKAEYGQQLKTIVEHLDEAHPHLHCFVIPSTGKAKDIHPGHAAELASKDPKERKLRYQKGMVAFQDRYWKMVGKPCGLERVGPRRKRVEREKIIAARKVEELIQKAKMQADQIMQQAREMAIKFLRDAIDRKDIEMSIKELEKNVTRSSKPRP